MAPELSTNGNGNTDQKSPVAANPQRSSVQFNYDQKSNILTAELTPDIEALPLSLAELKRQLTQAGFGDFYLEKGILASVVEEAKVPQTLKIDIGEKRDAILEIELAVDNMSATVSSRKPYGGQPLTLQLLKQALIEKGISPTCFNKTALQEVVDVVEVNKQVVAEGKLPERGKDAHFISLFAEEEAKPAEDARGKVNLRQVQEFLAVEPDTPLVEKVPRTRGKAGMNVKGEKLNAEPGQDIPLSSDDGVKTDPKNENIILAAIKGHPLIGRTNVKVDKVLRLSAVDMSSGNVEFDGSVDIAGNVESGFTVKVSGDIYVKGLVEKCLLIAKGRIVVGGGIVGEEPDMKAPDGEKPLLKTVLKAGQGVEAKYITLANIATSGDLKVREYILHSQVDAKGDVLLGQDGGKGCIIGGWTHSDTAVIANMLGSDAYVPTEIDVGAPEDIESKLQYTLKKRNKRHQEQVKLEAVLAKIKNVDSPQKIGQTVLHKTRKISNTIDLLTKTVSDLDRQISGLRSQVNNRVETYIQFSKQMFPNVAIRIDGTSLTNNQEQRAKKLVNHQGEIVQAES